MTIFRGSFVHNFDYKINGMVLDRVKLVRDLGIYFDSGWTFDNYIEFITPKALDLLRELPLNLDLLRLSRISIKPWYCLNYCMDQ